MKNQTRNAAELYSTMLNELFPKENIEKELDYNNVEELKLELSRLIQWSNRYGKGVDNKIDNLRKRIESLTNVRWCSILLIH